jgi:hypothetical protein
MYKMKLYNALLNKIIRLTKMLQFHYFLSVTDEHMSCLFIYKT